MALSALARRSWRALGGELLSAPQPKKAASLGEGSADAAPDSGRKARAGEPARSLDRRALVHALTEVILADLLKYPPKP